MKKSLSISFIFSFISVLVFAQTEDQEAIKKVCHAETQAYNNFDFNTWASYHVQSADEQLSWNNADGSFGSQSGWEEISKGMKDWFKTAQKENLKQSTGNFMFIIHGDIALVSYSTTSQKADGKTTMLRDYKTLLNVKGQWKILTVQSYADYSPVK